MLKKRVSKPIFPLSELTTVPFSTNNRYPTVYNVLPRKMKM